MKVEVTRYPKPDGYPSRYWAVIVDGDLLAVTVYRKGAVHHIRWDSRPVVRRILRWANNIALGKDDRRQTPTKAEFVEDGTVGLVPART